MFNKLLKKTETNPFLYELTKVEDTRRAKSNKTIKTAKRIATAMQLQSDDDGDDDEGKDRVFARADRLNFSWKIDSAADGFCWRIEPVSEYIDLLGWRHVFKLSHNRRGTENVASQGYTDFDCSNIGEDNLTRLIASIEQHIQKGGE